MGAPSGLVRHVARTRLGRVEVFGEDLARCRRGVDVALSHASAERAVGTWIAWDGARAYFKGSALHGRARARWTLKHGLLRSRLPRVRELMNLRWLRARVFQAPLPLCAGVLSRGGAPWYQFLATEEVVGAQTLEAFLRTSEVASAERAEVFAELACEVARLHALGFVHHDLYPRNLLVAPGAAHTRLFFLDAWAGGPPPQWRARAYDIACLLLRAGSTWQPAEVDAFLARYFAERVAQDRPADPGVFLARVRRERARLIERLRQRPEELRGEPLPTHGEIEFARALHGDRNAR